MKLIRTWDRDHVLVQERASKCIPRQPRAAAREDLDLTELFRCLEHWRRASERLTGQPVPDDEPLAQTWRRAGL